MCWGKMTQPEAELRGDGNVFSRFEGIRRVDMICVLFVFAFLSSFCKNC